MPQGDDGNHSNRCAENLAMSVTASFLNATRYNDGVLFSSLDESMAQPAALAQRGG